jgi:hypothetical protein
MTMLIPQAELEGLFQRFAAPFIGSPLGEAIGTDLATQMAQTLWRTMIDGLGIEEQAFQEMESVSPLAPKLLEQIRHCYDAEMKPQATAEQLDSLRQWYAKGLQGGFTVGDRVRVRYAAPDPDYADLPLGGWAGTITSIDEEGNCTIKLNQQTLDHIPSIFRRRCERDGLTIEELQMQQADLDPDLGEGLELEEPTNIQTKPLDPAEPEDRLRAALGVTTDDAVPLVEKPILLRYFEYLKGNLVFPFPATYSHHDGKRRIFRRVSVVGLSDEFPIEDEYGLVSRVKDDKEEWEVPLLLLEVGLNDRNSQLLTDYRWWFTEWGEFVPPPPPHATGDYHDEEEDVEPEPLASKKVGRNDPCPCGSGKKFKKCCLNKSRQGGLFD